MRFHVAQLLKAGIGATRTYELHEADVEVADDGSRGPVEGTVTLLRTKSGILLRAALRLRCPDACSRCLTPIDVPVELQIEEEYLPTVDVLTGAVRPRPEEPGAFVIDEHHILDLAEAVRQYRVLALPMQPLCRPDCAGLCPVCGHNLNESACACDRDEYDPRWGTLAKLTPAKPESD